MKEENKTKKVTISLKHDNIDYLTVLSKRLGINKSKLLSVLLTKLKTSEDNGLLFVDDIDFISNLELTKKKQ